MLNIKAYFDDVTKTVTYLISDTESREAAIIDPVLDYEPHAATLRTNLIDRILADVESQKLSLIWVLDTHAHADHLSAAHYVREQTGAKIGIGARIKDVQSVFSEIFNINLDQETQYFDAFFDDGDEISLGTRKISIMHTPGHTPACVTYIVDNNAFVGDTLFMPDYGTARADFPGGDAATLYRSIQRILSLPSETRIFVGHDYLPEGRDYPAWETTVREQKANNVHLRGGVSEADFVAMRQARDATLDMPRLILPSLQVNIRGGQLPKPETNGHVYLKLPVNRL